MKNIGAIVSVLAVLSGCASIIEGQSQNVSLTTNPPVDAICEAKNARGSWKVAPLPASLMLKRSKSDLVITCNGSGYSGQTTNGADMEAWAAMNLLWGIWFPIAGIIDASTGALFSYDDGISVTMKPQDFSAQKASAAPIAAVPAAEIASPAVDIPAEAPTNPPSVAAPAPTAVQPAANVAPANSYSYDDLVARGVIVSSPVVVKPTN